MEQGEQRVVERSGLTTAEASDQATEFIREIIYQIGLDLNLSSAVQGAEVSIEFQGEDMEMLLADNARLLYALNHLVNQIFYRRSADGVNFFLDCHDYRETRAMELQLLARKAAEQVDRTGKKFKLQPMPASERRVVHLALANDRAVRTESEGSGRFRRVLILPA